MKKILSVLTITLLSIGIATGCSNESKSQDTGEKNQAIYKTIDFQSYNGDINSTEFNDLVNKKVTFTNVPSLGGTLGNMSKSIGCRNESSYTIEDAYTYTVTGVVTSHKGTYSVTLKDCTIEKN